MTEPKSFFAVHRQNRIYFNELLPVGYKLTHFLISLLDDITHHDDKLAFAFKWDENETGTQFVARNIADESDYGLADGACEKLIEAYNEYFDIEERPAPRPR